MVKILNELRSKKLLSVVTGSLPAKGSLYLGIDPTANSLHVGHLLGIKTLLRFGQFGYEPIILIGGATGLVGDPTFRDTGREEISIEAVRQNVSGIESDIKNILKNSKSSFKVEIVNNLDWIGDTRLLEFLRDVGTKFRVQHMLAKKSMQNRQKISHTGGLTFTELSYQLLQAYDFGHLYSQYGCKIQLGGSDQFGNITAGIDYIGKTYNGEAFGVTYPLLVNDDGTKLGKSQGNAIWLNSDKTSPVDYYNYFFNTDDDKVEDLLLQLSDLSVEEVRDIMGEQKVNPKERIAQKTLAKELMVMVHGSELLMETEAKLEALYSRQGSVSEIENVLPDQKIAFSKAEAMSLSDFLLEIDFVKSKTEAFRLTKSNGITVNDDYISSACLKKSLEQFISQKRHDDH